MKAAIYLLAAGCTIMIRDCNGKEHQVEVPCEIPSTAPSIVPSANPSPIPVPSALPSIEPLPTPPPFSPEPTDVACRLEVDGNFPVPNEGECPSCWKSNETQNKYGSVISHWGLMFRSKTKCTKHGVNCPLGLKVNVDKTPHSKKPFLAHRFGGGSETWKACQPPLDSEEIPDIWVYPPNSIPGLCDNFSGSRYWCHHKPQANQAGPTKFELQSGSKPSIMVQVP